MAIIKTKGNKISWLLCAAFLVCAVVIGTTVACGPAEKDTSKIEADKKGVVEFEGIAEVAVGKYVFIPEAGGFDIVVQGNLENEGIYALEGKQVRGKGTINKENPSVLIAETLEIKDESENWRNIFTRTDEAVLDDYVNLDQREEFSFLEGLAYNKKDAWEGKEKAKIYGEYSEGEEGKKITVYNQDGNEKIGSVIVDNISDFALFYMKKLRLFDKFYFYVEIKDTVDWSIRSRTKEMFHADVVFIGLF
ncbi:MAG: hypothetical protein J7L72_10615 [Candidatus Aminicenantes bacterium]|nr:hypothetical protein [Candidatus Aminicenantes bacterium]